MLYHLVPKGCLVPLNFYAFIDLLIDLAKSQTDIQALGASSTLAFSSREMSSNAI